MPVIPLLPLFHKFNSQYFENSLAVNNQPLVKVRWSDNRLKTTAGFYKRKRINGLVDSEIILSKPILSKLSNSEINSTLCHEMIHAWVDRILKKNEIHGPNFLNKMREINAIENNFLKGIYLLSFYSLVLAIPFIISGILINKFLLPPITILRTRPTGVTLYIANHFIKLMKFLFKEIF